MVYLNEKEKGMHRRSETMCQYLKGSNDGARCSVVNTLIRDIEDADIRLCMNRHYEACSYYMFALRKCVLTMMAPDAAFGTTFKC